MSVIIVSWFGDVAYLNSQLPRNAVAGQQNIVID